MAKENISQNLEDHTESLALQIARLGLDKKADHLKVIEVSEHCSFADFFVLMNGTSERHVSSLADHIMRSMRTDFRKKPLSFEGHQECQWVLVDFGDVVVHIFHPDSREFYQLDELWEHAPQVEIPQEFYLGSEPSLTTS
jgi:ribosome-associated protein